MPIIGKTTVLLAFSGVLAASLSACSSGSSNKSVVAKPGTLEFVSATYSINEGQPTATFTVARTGGSDRAVSVEFATADGTANEGNDYTGTSGTLTWAHRDSAEKTFTVTILDDALDEDDETLSVTLSSPTAGATLGGKDTAVLTILDDDLTPEPGVIQFQASEYSVREDGLEVTITVTRTGGSDGLVTVDFTTSDGTATAGDDYVGTSGTLSWDDGDSTDKMLTVFVLEDAVDEDDETVILSLASATGGVTIGAQNPASIVIEDIYEQGAVAFGAPSYVVDENKFTLTLTVKRTGGSDGAVSVLYSSLDGTALAGGDYTAISGRLTWDHGDAEDRVLVLPVTDDALTEGDESLSLHLVSPEGGVALGAQSDVTVTIVEDDAPAAGLVQFSHASYEESENAGTLTIVVTRTGAYAGAAQVTVVDAGTGTATVVDDYEVPFAPTTVAWADNDFADQLVEITVLNDDVGEPIETIEVALQGPVGADLGTQGTAVVHIVDNDGTAGTVEFTAEIYAGYEPGDPVTVTVERIGGAEGAVLVDYVTSDGSATDGLDYTGVSGTLSWEAGDVEPKSFDVPLIEDVITEGGESFAVTLSNPLGGAILGTKSEATVVIVDNEPPGGLLQYKLGTYTANEADLTATIIVSRTVGTQGEVSVDFATTDGTAFDGSDYTGTADTLTWGDGDVLDKTFEIEILDDAIIEGTAPETIHLTLDNVVGEAALGVLADALVQIVDDDTPSAGFVQFLDAAFSVEESTGEATVTISRVDGSYGPASVSFRTENGSATPKDYVPTATMVSWADGDDTDKTVTITIKTKGQNQNPEGPETVNLVLFSAQGATLGDPSSAVLTIED